MQRLIIQEQGKEETWAHECAEDEITFGRLDDNLIQLKSEGVSRRHAKIAREGENLYIIDTGSGNGTFLNGVRLKPDTKNLLKVGDRITIDTFDISLHPDSLALGNADEEITENDVLEVKLLKKVLTALDKDMVPSLEVLNGSAEGKKIFLTDEQGEIVIGRDPDTDFSINEYVISRQHARITKRWGGISIRDLESKNGTFINNRRVVEEYLHDGDRVALGTIVLMFRNPQEINLAELAYVKPKYKPADVSPADIPGLEVEPSKTETPPAKAAAQSQPRPESSAEADWEKVEKSLSGLAPYPTPHAKIEAIKRLTPIEIGMIGLGTLVLIFALITIVNLLSS